MKSARRRSSAPVRVGIIDANASLRDAAERRFTELGWHVQTLAAPVPHSALVPFRLHVLILDIEPLGPHGWTYLNRLTKELPDMGVVVHTGRSTVAQRVRGLSLGVDDWATRPLEIEELAARVEAVVRRRRRLGEAEELTLSIGELELRVDQFQAFVGPASVGLTPREFELLLLLARAQGQVLPREAIYERLWGYAMVTGDRSVDVIVGRVRQKLKTVSPGWNYLHTTFSVGYRFAPARTAL